MEVPNDYKTAGLLNMIGGALNIIASGLMALSLIMICVGVLWVVPMAIGAWQMYVGYQMNNGQPTAQGKTAAIAGVVASLCSFNLFAAACSGFAFVQLGKPEVAGWLEQRS